MIRCFETLSVRIVHLYGIIEHMKKRQLISLFIDFKTISSFHECVFPTLLSVKISISVSFIFLCISFPVCTNFISSYIHYTASHMQQRTEEKISCKLSFLPLELGICVTMDTQPWRWIYQFSITPLSYSFQVRLLRSRDIVFCVCFTTYWLIGKRRLLRW